MADSQKVLEVLIKFGVQDAAAKQAVAEIKQLDAATRGQGEASKKAAVGQNELERAFHRSYGKGDQLRHMFREISRELPGVGAAMRFAFSPATALVGLAVTGFLKARAALAEWEAELDAAGKKAAEPISTLGEALVEASRVGKSSLQVIADGLTKIKEEAEAAVEKIRAIEQAQAELVDQQLARELAAIGADEKEGLIKPEEAVVRRFRARETAERVKEDQRKAAEEATRQAKQGELDAARFQKEFLARQAPDAGTKALAEAKTKSLPADIAKQEVASKAWQAKRDEQLRKRDELQQELDRRSKSNPQTNDPMLPSWSWGNRQRAKIAGLDADLSTQNPHLPALDTMRQNLADAGATITAMKSLETSLSKLGADVTRLENAVNRSAGVNAAVAPLQAQARANAADQRLFEAQGEYHEALIASLKQQAEEISGLKGRRLSDPNR